MIAGKIMPIIYWLVSSLKQPAWTVLEVGNKLCRSYINSSFHSLKVSDWWRCQCYRITLINNQHFQMRNPSSTLLSFWVHFVCTQTQQIKYALQIQATINVIFLKPRMEIWTLMRFEVPVSLHKDWRNNSSQQDFQDLLLHNSGSKLKSHN